MGEQPRDATRWAARPRSANAVRVAVFVGPVVTSFAVAWAVTGTLPPSTSRSGQVAHLAVLLVVSTAVLFVLWLYYTAIVFLLGAVVAETWELRKMQQRQRAILG